MGTIGKETVHFLLRELRMRVRARVHACVCVCLHLLAEAMQASTEHVEHGVQRLLGAMHGGARRARA